MDYKWIGAILVLAGCGGFGLSIGISYHRRENLLKNLIKAVSLMENEIQYRLTPLPDLMEMAGEESGGILANIFHSFAQELQAQSSSDPGGCMGNTLSRFFIQEFRIKQQLRELGRCLGKYDLPGQLRGLEAVKQQCDDLLEQQILQRKEKLRCYQTLSVCAGIALAILLL